MKTIKVTYMCEIPGDSKMKQVRQQAAEKFKIPEAAVKLMFGNQVLKEDESVAIQLRDGAEVFVELDQENFESNEMKIKRDKMEEKLQQSQDVKKLLDFYSQNPKVVEPFILSAQDKVAKSLKIIKFVDELKDTEVTNGKEGIQKIKDQVTKGNAEYQKECQQFFPITYLKYKFNKDEVVEVQYNVENAKKEMKTVYGSSYPLALVGDEPMHAEGLKGPESDNYELDECEKKNITTVLVENLFTEIAVLMIMLKQVVDQGAKQTFANYQESDKYEDLKKMYMLTFYNLIELTDVKDMLLGQYVNRAKKLDQEKIKLGFKAYIDSLKRDYGEQLERVRLMGVEQPDEDVLQRLEANGGDVEKTFQEFLNMK